MKTSVLLLALLILTGCAGGAKNNEVSEREMYYEKRVRCDKTKTTDETANITQCADIRPDAE